MLRDLLLIFCGFIITLSLFSQQRNNNDLVQDSIILEYSAKIGIFYKHTFKPKQTLYGLARFFGSSPEEVYSFNPSLKNKSIQIGEDVVIPVRNNLILTDNIAFNTNQDLLDVYYLVKAQDNLFRIARHYFYQPIQYLMRRNNLVGFDLSPGQILHVGWIRRSSTQNLARIIDQKDSLRLLQKNKIIPVPRNEVELSSLEDTTTTISIEPIKMNVRRVTATWNKDSKDYQNLFVLHPTARINSMIELYNPMLNRKVYAEVIGKIPPQLYSRDISLIVSPKVAQSLGVRDTRFLVEMRYIE